MPKRLASCLDELAQLPDVFIVETSSAITVGNLSCAQAIDAANVAQEVGWTPRITDSGGEDAHLDDLLVSLQPYKVIIPKPVTPGVRTVVTSEGFLQALANPEVQSTWQIARLETPFQSGLISFHPWGAGDVFTRATELKSPKRFVREPGGPNLVPKDIRMWLLRGELSEALWADAQFRIFAETAIPNLLRSLANEVPSSAEIVFNGPPRRTFPIASTDRVLKLGFSGIRLLQEAVAWVYEDNYSVEQRHVFFSAEFARQSAREKDIEAVIRDGGADILQGARFAFNLSISELGKDALKSQADLRKSVADDTSKASENARGVAAALATAVATGIGMLAVRTSTNLNASPWLISAVAIAVAIYLIVVCVSALHHLKVQSSLRSEWRKRFYQFVPDEDYALMVTKPVSDAEMPVRVVSWLALAGAVLLIVVALWPMIPPEFWQWSALRPPTPVARF